jgi:hypothetical protein
VNFTSHKNQGMTTKLLNKGPALCLAPQQIKDNIDKKGNRKKQTHPSAALHSSGYTAASV